MRKISSSIASPLPSAKLDTPIRATREQLIQFLRTIEPLENTIGSQCEFFADMFQVREAQDDERIQVEKFISDCFKRAYKARITRFKSRLFELMTRRGELTAAFGVSRAADEPLFLETYLDRPIESVLEERIGYRPARNSIVEVGNLAAIYPGAIRWLFMALTVLLHREGYKWVVFTAGNELKNGFSRLGFHPISLAPANIECLKEEDRNGWGHYYDTAPVVMAGNIEVSYREMENRRAVHTVGEND
jgi:hypothetical protein